MKFIPFEQSTHKVGEGKDQIQFFAHGGSCVFLLELTRDELIKLKDNDGKIWVRSLTPLPPPIQLTLSNPFKPLTNATSSKESTSNDK